MGGRVVLSIPITASNINNVTALLKLNHCCFSVLFFACFFVIFTADICSVAYYLASYIILTASNNYKLDKLAFIVNKLCRLY